MEIEFPALIRELSHLYFLSQNAYILGCFVPLCPFTNQPGHFLPLDNSGLLHRLQNLGWKM